MAVCQRLHSAALYYNSVIEYDWVQPLLLTLESYLQKLKRKMLAFELHIKTPILNPLCKLVEPLASSEVAAHFLTIMGNGVCAPDVAEWAGTTQEELPQPAC